MRTKHGAFGDGGLRREPIFTGVGVALVTLFDDDGRLDAPATADLALRLVELGVRAVVVAGSTGEASALSPDERSALLRAVRDAVGAGAGVPVIAGSGAAGAGEAAELTRRAREDGAEAVLALTPPGSDDLARYYGSVAKAAGDLPVLGYHFPARSSPGIALEELPELPIAGLKDSTADADRLLQTLAIFDRPLYTGSSALVALAGTAGAAGAILALANARPELCQEAFNGSLEAQRELVADHLVTKASFPGGIKRLTAARFGTSVADRSERATTPSQCEKRPTSAVGVVGGSGSS
jgi:4-hydroxy-tetrahydrodipicolinate synthase